MSLSFYNQVLPIVVLYKQEISQSLTLISLDKNLEEIGINMDVYVYDNSPIRQYDKDSFQWNNFHVFYFHDPENSGLSKAYNAGAVKAAELKKEWILLLDQDTTFASGYLQENNLSVLNHPDINLFAPILKLKNSVIFSPCIAKHKRGYPPGRLVHGQYSLYDFSPVNSGMLIRLAMFHRVDGYNEKVKIDFCDFQFLEKFRLLSDSFYLINAVALQDFSNFEPSAAKQKVRFTQYLEDAYHCDKPSVSDKIGFLYAVTRHAVGLTVKMKNISFMSMYFSNYLIR